LSNYKKYLAIYYCKQENKK